jgi:hypothetical protein
MTKMPIYLQIVLTLGLIATTIPIASGYFVGFLLFAWLLKTGNWRLGAFWLPTNVRKDSFSRAEEINSEIKAVNWLFLGIGVWFLTSLLSGVGSYFSSPWHEGALSQFKIFSHLGLKYALLPWVIVTSYLVVIDRKYSLVTALNGFAVWLVFHTAYLLLQRYTGVDWVHGLNSVLGSHREAYGVFRISGFMAHPLTLSYNFALLTLVGINCLLRGIQEKALWVITATGFFTLLIGGSRYPIIVLTLLLCGLEYRQILKYKSKVAAVFVMFMILLWWEGSIIGRFVELFANSGGMIDRFPRLSFWQVHFAAFWDQPIFGVGISGREPAMLTYYNAAGYHDKIYTAHNVFLQTMADSGLVGLSGLVSFYSCLFKSSKLKSSASRGMLSLFLACLLFGLLQNTLRDSEYLYTFWICFTLLLTLRRHAKKS